MSDIKCELFCNSNSGHLQLIYTGFKILANQKKINLSYRILKHSSPDFPNPSQAELYVKVNDSISILFDMTDFGELRNDLLEQVDFYFKRSYSPLNVGEKHLFRKVFPLGLHYRVCAKYPTWFSVKRSSLENSRKEIRKALFQEILGPLNSIHPQLYRMHIDNCHAKPDYSLEPGVIFMANLWDPNNTKAKYMEERETLNKMRTECVQKLKSELGNRFKGGILPSEFARKNYPHLMTTDPGEFQFGNYMKILKRFPIGVATTGLHKSIGWKFAEYVAFSKAIASERLNYQAPGLEAGKHYAEFTSSDECVTVVTMLMEDRHFRNEMMANNHEYYNEFLRPDALIWNALTIALQRQY